MPSQQRFVQINLLPRALGCCLLALCAVTTTAHADQTAIILGGGVGAAAGAVIGQSVGGHQGAIIGAAVGGAAGAAVGSSVGHAQHSHRASGPEQYGRPVGYHYDKRAQWDRDDDRRHNKHGRHHRGHGYGHDKHGD
jgi:hypothetical protein